MRHRRRMGAWISNCLGHLASAGLFNTQAAQAVHHCSAAGNCCCYCFQPVPSLHRSHHSCCLQDLLSVPQPAVKDFLQSLLRDASVLKVRPGTDRAWTRYSIQWLIHALLRSAPLCSNTCWIALQVGYGLVHDLWAIAAVLGDEGLGCVSVVEPQLDVGTLHRQLHKAHVPGINKVRQCQWTSAVTCICRQGTSTVRI